VCLLRCLFYTPVTDSSQLTVPTDEQLAEVYQNDLVMNVFRNGVFGSFRHILLLSGGFSVFFGMSAELGVW